MLFMLSSQGNEAYIEANELNTENKVIASSFLIYIKANFYEGGCELIGITGFDLEGNALNFIKNKIVKELA